MMAAVPRPRTLAVAALAAVLAAGCAGSDQRARGSEGVLRLGVQPTLTHAVAHVGLASGIFRRVLGDTRIETTVLNSGAEASVALASGTLDAAYIGAWPAASLYLRGGRVALIAGAAVGGASLVVRSAAGIRSPADLHGTRIAVPSFANSQDVALRTWLHDHGLTATDEGGDVSVVTADPRELAQLFRLGRIDGAWVAEPYPTVLVADGLGRRLVDEASLWPDGRFATAGLLVSTGYMRTHPDVVRDLLEAEVETIRFMNEHPQDAMAIASDELVRDGAPPMPSEVLASAWKRISFTWAVAPFTFARLSRDAYALGMLDEPPADVLGIFRLDALNGVLDDDGLPRVPEPSDAEVS
jgi:NitT/TauT family transport system substrate-binding protein